MGAFGGAIETPSCDCEFRAIVAWLRRSLVCLRLNLRSPPGVTICRLRNSFIALAEAASGNSKRGGFCYRASSTTRLFRKADAVAHPAPQGERRPGCGHRVESHRSQFLLLGDPHAQLGPTVLALVLALLRVGDKHIDLLGRHGLGEKRGRGGIVGRPIGDGSRSIRVPEGGVEVTIFREGFGMEVEGLIFVRNGTGGCPGHAHRDIEGIVGKSIGDGNGRVQARREQLRIDLEISGGRETGGFQQRGVRADVRHADKDEGATKRLIVGSALRSVNVRKGVDTAIGAQVVEAGGGGQALGLELEGGWRCGMSCWNASGKSEG